MEKAVTLVVTQHSFQQAVGNSANCCYFSFAQKGIEQAICIAAALLTVHIKKMALLSDGQSEKLMFEGTLEQGMKEDMLSYLCGQMLKAGYSARTALKVVVLFTTRDPKVSV